MWWTGGSVDREEIDVLELKGNITLGRGIRTIPVLNIQLNFAAIMNKWVTAT